MFKIIDATININLLISVIALIILSIMFGILTGSVLSALMFPRALYSMLREGDLWAIWVISSLFIWLVWNIVKRWVLRAARPSPRS